MIDEVGIDDFVVFTVSSNEEDYDRLLSPSIKAIPGLKSEKILGHRDSNIAHEYNQFMMSREERFIIFAHQDVSFSDDLIEAFCREYDPSTIGACGMIGRGEDDVYYFGGMRRNIPSNVSGTQDVSCLDSCLMILDKNHDCQFDEDTFDGLHCFIEDYCCLQRSLDRRVIVLGMRETLHWGTTSRRAGSAWGEWGKYRNKLTDKWGGTIHTT